MSFILYCLIPNNKQLTAPELPTGVINGAVRVLNEEKLSAVISEVSDVKLLEDVEEAKKFHQVVEKFHSKATVVPFRYGSIFENEVALQKFLRENQENYQTVLSELEGLTEMSVRILYAGKANRLDGLDAAKGIGHSYLSQKAKTLASQIEPQELQKISDALIKKTASLTRRYLREIRQTDGNWLLSLYFLICREEIENFRQIAQDFGKDSSITLAVTGNWSPYNFV